MNTSASLCGFVDRFQPAQGRSTKHTKQLEEILSDSILVWLR